MLLPFDDPQTFAPLTGQLDRYAERLDERILPRRWEGTLRRTLEAEAIAASTSMEGVPVTVDDALKILAGDRPDSVSDRDQALVRGYRDAMTYVQRRADDGRLRWNRELVVAVQDRVLAGDYGEGAGRLRTGAAWVRNTMSGDVVFQPPQHEEVPALVDEVCEVISAADWHPAVQAAWVHIALAAVHPFKDGNGRTARVLASLTMYRGDFRHPAFTNLEEWWGKHPADYYAAFACLGSEFERDVDVTSFVMAHLRAQLAQVFSLAMRQRTDGMLWTTLENLLDDRGLPARLANALYDAFYGRSLTSTYYRSLIDASPATARNDLGAATATGLLRATGRTRGRRYLAGPKLVPAVAKTIGVEADLEAVVGELVRRATSGVDWAAPESVVEQQQLPGVG